MVKTEGETTIFTMNDSKFYYKYWIKENASPSDNNFLL